MKITRMPRLSLLAKFTVVALLLTAVIATGIAWAIQHRLEEVALEQAAERTAGEVETKIVPALAESDLEGPMEPERYEQINSLIETYTLGEPIANVKLWNREGLLVYSRDGEGVGSFFPHSEDLDHALQGETHSEISRLEKEENLGERRGSESLLEVYTPVQLEGSANIIGAFEVYEDLSEVNANIAIMRRHVALSVGGGYLLLFGSLFILVRNASQEIRQRSLENRQLLQNERARKQELSTLYDIARALAASAPEPDPVLNLIVRRTAETVHTTFARIMLKENGNLVERAAYPVRLLGRRFNPGERIPGSIMTNCVQVMMNRKPVVLHAKDFPKIAGREADILMLDAVRSICLVPLLASESPLGLLIMGEARSEEREPFTPEKVNLARGIADQAVSALKRAELFTELETAYLDMVTSLARAVEAKDTYTAGHAENLATMASAMGRKLEMAKEELEDLRYSAVLHDAGKIGVPDAVLQKPGRLDDKEWIIMRRHPEIGAQILSPIHRLSGAANIIRHHHERFDGSGYPDSLAGEEIPLGARILTVVDSYSAITDRRVYKEAKPHEFAIQELVRNAGTQFDPDLVTLFLEMFESGEMPEVAATS